MRMMPETTRRLTAWRWVSVPLTVGPHRVALHFEAAPGSRWAGSARSWLVGRVFRPTFPVTWRGAAAASEPPMPPSPWPVGEARRQFFDGEAAVSMR